MYAFASYKKIIEGEIVMVNERRVRVGGPIGGHMIAEVGTNFRQGDYSYTPVRLADGTCAIVYELDGGETVGIWDPNTEPACDTFLKSIDIPTIELAEPDVLHVKGRDSQGSFTIKMFCNNRAGVPAELHRDYT